LLIESVRVAGDEINETIGRYLLKNYRIQVGENTAEKCKMEIGSAYPVDGLSSLYNIAGKDSISSSPKEISLSAEEIRKAIEEPVYAVIDAIRRALEKTPPDLVVDINMDGMYLTGGGALLKGLDKLIHKETKIKCNVIEDPLISVVLGSGKALEDMKKYSRVFIN
jgi:rod shape-determining protein MreB